jgi:hypothetical protein
MLTTTTTTTTTTTATIHNNRKILNNKQKTHKKTNRIRILALATTANGQYIGRIEAFVECVGLTRVDHEEHLVVAAQFVVFLNLISTKNAKTFEYMYMIHVCMVYL